MQRTTLMKRLQKMQDDAGTRQALAKQLKIAPGHLSDIFNGNREPGPELLKRLGLERKVTYVEAEK